MSRNRILQTLALLGITLSTAACGGGGGGGASDDAPALPAPYVTDFDAAGSTDGWLFWDPNDENTPPSADVATLWAFDGSAPSMPGGAAHSGASSLNYNNGANYDTGGANAGVAISPKIDIGPLTQPALGFWCNYETETDGAAYDKRVVKVGKLNSDGSQTIYFEAQLSALAGDAGVCEAMGTWHTHIIALNASWGEVRVAMGFDSIDDYLNDYHGWFVDDFMIDELENVAATLLAPGEGGGDLPGGGGDLPGGGGDVPPDLGGGGDVPPDFGGGDVPPDLGGDVPPDLGGDEPPATGGGDEPPVTGGEPPALGDGNPGDTTSGGATFGNGGTSAGGGTYGGGTGGDYSEDFEGATDGWTFEGGAGDGDPAWAFDATPATVPGGPVHGGAASLNYNNGADYDTPGLPNSGTATSPAIALSGNPVLTFWCNYNTETDGADFDKRTVAISVDGFASTVFAETLSNGNTPDAPPSTIPVPVSGACVPGQWHQHSIELDASWGSVQVRFGFDTVDEVNNAFAGWFVDDIAIVQGESDDTATDSGSPASAGGAGGGGGGGSGCSAGSPVGSFSWLALVGIIALMGKVRR